METMDIRKDKSKRALSKKTKIEADHRYHSDEVLKLRESIEKLEKERDDMKLKLDRVIEKVEIYLSRSEA